MVQPLKRQPTKANPNGVETVLRPSTANALLHFSIKFLEKTDGKMRIVIFDDDGRFDQIIVDTSLKRAKMILQVTTLLHSPSITHREIDASRMKMIFGKHSPVFLACSKMLSDNPSFKTIHDNDLDVRSLYLKLLGFSLLLGQFNQSSSFDDYMNLDHIMTRTKALKGKKGLIQWDEQARWLTNENIRSCIEFFLLPIISRLKFKKEDLFLELHQDLFEIDERSGKGAFYTPPILAELVINESFQENDIILDPACGTGVFLVGILKKFLKNIRGTRNWEEKLARFIEHQLHGIDIDDTAVFLTKINLLLLLKDFPSVLEQLTTLNMYQADALFLEPSLHSRMKKKFTLCIGNPPWLVLNVITDKKRKHELKNFAKTTGLLPAPHLVTQLELSVLFVEKMKQFYLKPRGKIAFILNKTILESENHAKTRQFTELINIRVWSFDTVIFRLPHICFFAEYLPNFIRDEHQLINMKIPVTLFEMERKQHDINKLIKKNTILHHPMSVRTETTHQSRTENPTKISRTTASFLVGKLLPKEQIDSLLPRGKNIYRDTCRNGASLFPRNLITIKILDHQQEEENGKLITTFQHVIERPRKPWNFDPLKKLNLTVGRVESHYIFRVARSREIVPFALLETITVFLPIEPDDETRGYRFTKDKESLGWRYFNKLSDLYRQHAKQGASITNFWKYLNYQGKITTPLQRKPIRVVFAASGSRIKGFLLTDDSVIVDFKCYHLPVATEDEGHYLLGILHAPIVSADVISRSGERVYHKRPLDYPIPPFNPKNKLHRTLAQQARTMQQQVQVIIHQWKEKNARANSWQPLTIQRLIRSRLADEFAKLDDLVKSLLKINHEND